MTWHRSSFCADGACVEVADLGEHIAIRDGKNLEQPPVKVTRDDWYGFLGAITRKDRDRSDEF